MERLARGEPADALIDDRLLACYAVAGTPGECVEDFRVYRDAGVTELGVWPVGDRTVEAIARLGEAVAALRR